VKLKTYLSVYKQYYHLKIPQVLSSSENWFVYFVLPRQLLMHLLNIVDPTCRQRLWGCEYGFEEIRLLLLLLLLLCCYA